MLATISNWGPDFKVTMVFKINSFPSSGSSDIISFITSEGYKVPNIEINDQKELVIASTIGRDPNWTKVIKVLATEKWYNIEVHQYFEDDKVDAKD